MTRTSVALSLSYVAASVLFILCLGGLSGPKTARRGLVLGELGMLVAVVGTLFYRDIVRYDMIIAGLLLGSLVGVAISAWIPMTKMPERIALSHSFGGLATALVGVAAYLREGERLTQFKMGALGLETLLGFLTFSGSIVAFGKLQGFVSGAPIKWQGQNVTNVGLLFAALAAIGFMVIRRGAEAVFFGIAGSGLAVGVMAVLPIGGADMPVVISLLNAYAGLAACATGFALSSQILIIAGALDGSSGLLLSILMSRAMNRTFTNVLFGAFGGPIASEAAAPLLGRSFNEATIEDAGRVLRVAQSVIFVPGYGMAVSRAQHAVRDLAAALERRGVDVRYAIHPVAGRMPGHMNVLLAEANVSYDRLFDLDDINDDFARTDAVVVVGANDVVNPAAKSDSSSPIYGMPVFHVERSRSVIVVKRSMSPGFSGVENELFFQSNTMMVFGDARKTLLAVAGELETGGG